jgi:hypothetical protein
MKNRKNNWIVLGVVIVVFCFVPVVPVSYEVITEKQVTEEYTTVEPYIVQEAVDEPYAVQLPSQPYWQGDIGGHWVTPPPRLATGYRTITKDVTKYREVTKTRLVSRPVVETQTKRVSLLRYLLR